MRLAGLTIACQMVLDEIGGVVERQLGAGQARTDQLQRQVERQFGNVTFQVASCLRDEQMGQGHEAHVV